MRTFEYAIKDELGIHARPAGMLVKEAKAFASEITIKKGDKEAGCTKLMASKKLYTALGTFLSACLNPIEYAHSLSDSIYIKQTFTSVLYQPDD